VLRIKGGWLTKFSEGIEMTEYYYADRLQAAMTVADVTVSELSRMIGTSPQSMKKTVEGGSVPEPENQEKIATALGVTVAWLSLGVFDPKTATRTECIASMLLASSVLDTTKLASAAAMLDVLGREIITHKAGKANLKRRGRPAAQ